MDIIGTSLDNGTEITLDVDEQEIIERKPIIIEANLRDNRSNKVTHNQVLTTSKLSSLRMPVENNYQNAVSGTIYRVLPLKVDSSMEGITDNEVPVTPILASHLTSNESSEHRLALIASSDSTTDNSTVVVSGGQVYVISDSSSVTSSGRPFVPRTTDTVINQRYGSSREEKRRVTHNEVERRRRDKINSWICKLAKILPDTAEIQAKSSQVSKGGILAKACEYIEQLRREKQTLADKIMAMERVDQHQKMLCLEQDLEALKQENNMLKNELFQVKAHIHQQDIKFNS